jgi:hypothetical protein
MKILIQTNSPDQLRSIIFKNVEDEKIKTWIIRKDSSGNRFLTHKPEQWYDLALIGFDATSNQLEARITWWKDKEPSEDVKGYYLGRFVEILMVHFNRYFNNITITK